MNEKITPDIEKLGSDGNEPYALDMAWKILDERVDQLRREDLVDDLRPFFTNQDYIESWLDNFQDFYRRAREASAENKAWGAG